MVFSVCVGFVAVRVRISLDRVDFSSICQKIASLGNFDDVSDAPSLSRSVSDDLSRGCSLIQLSQFDWLIGRLN